MNPLLIKHGAAEFVALTLFLRKQTALRLHPIVTRIDETGAELQVPLAAEQTPGNAVPQALQCDIVCSAAALWMEAAAPEHLAWKFTQVSIALESQRAGELRVTVDGAEMTWTTGEHQVAVKVWAGGEGELQASGVVAVLIDG